MTNIDKTMNPNETEAVISTTDTETTENPVEETVETSSDPVITQEKVDVDALKKEIETLKFQKEHWKGKAEKKDDGKSSDLSSKDIIALTRGNVSDDDMDEVIDFAKYKKISISEALKSGTIKSLLKDKEEQRKTATATTTTTARRGSTKVSDEEIVAQVSQGRLPEDPADLAKARWNLKKAKKY